MFSFSICTLGCKLNQLESESIAGAFKRGGFEVLPWTDSGGAAEPGFRQSGSLRLLVINTCTVTSKAEQKARRIIRKSLREGGEAVLIVTGCYAQLDAGRIAALESGSASFTGAKGRFFVIPGDKKDALLDLPEFLAAAKPENTAQLQSLVQNWIRFRVHSYSLCHTLPGAFRFVPGNFSFHSRGFLKIQDGCDNHCTFCRVSIARGKSVSLQAENVLRNLIALERQGFDEAVLTGVNITQYEDGAGLPGLLEYLLAGTKTISLRLSSLEPEALTENFTSVLAHQRIRPHFHLSIQSGSPLVLKRMGRPYGPGRVDEGVRLLRAAKGDPFLACDIITGFPGETEKEFEKTFDLLKRINFAWIHAFPYSRRPDTAAWSFSGRVSEREAGTRVNMLMDLARQNKEIYVKRWIGREVGVIPEENTEKKPGYCRGVSDNYLKLLIALNSREKVPFRTLRCRITGLAPECDALAEEIGRTV
jgi:threonylcarbamoyladenosine tRNA methylthiotransferase MtaB